MLKFDKFVRLFLADASSWASLISNLHSGTSVGLISDVSIEIVSIFNAYKHSSDIK